MLRTKQILIRALVLAASVFNLVACGQTGSLYLPTRSTPLKQPTRTDTTKLNPQAAPTQEASSDVH